LIRSAPRALARSSGEIALFGPTQSRTSRRHLGHFVGTALAGRLSLRSEHLLPRHLQATRLIHGKSSAGRPRFVGRGWQRKAHLQIQRSSDGVLCVASFSLDQNHSTNSDTVGYTSAMTTTLPLAARRRVGKEAHSHLRGLRQVVPPLRKAYGSVVQMPPPAGPYNMSKWQEAKEKRNVGNIAGHFPLQSGACDVQ
jgi:hypothetical protein